MGTNCEPALLDARILAMHRLAVEKIQQQPQRMACVANNLARWRGCVSTRTMPYIEVGLCLEPHDRPDRPND